MAILPILIFIRHGETDWNAAGRLQGQRDIPLNDTGRAQARRNGTAIKAAMPEAAGFDFVASPLSRSRETMEIVRAAMGLPPEGYTTDDRLKELTFGAWEGLTDEDLRAVDAELIAARAKDKWGFLRMILGLDPVAAISTPFPQDRVLVFEDGRETWI